jgi:hypothetical protein
MTDVCHPSLNSKVVGFEYVAMEIYCVFSSIIYHLKHLLYCCEELEKNGESKQKPRVNAQSSMTAN